MKKLLLITLIVFISNYIFSQQVSKNYVVVEIGTGTWCTYCPGAAMGADDLVSNGHSVAIIENHGGDTYETTASAARNSYYAITGYPTAWFNGKNPYVGGNLTTSLYSNYLPKYNDAISVMSDFTLDLNYTSVGLTYSVVIDIAEVGNYSGSNLTVHLALTESYIEESWQGMSELNFVSRAMYPDHNGTDYSGGTESINFSFLADPNWDIDNCELVAFIQDYDTKEILQADKIMLSANPPYGTNNAILAKVGDIQDICEGTIHPTITVVNFGTDDILSMAIDYSINSGAVTGTYNWTGIALPFYETVEITLDEITFDLLASNSIDFEITEVNGSSDDYLPDNIGSKEFNQAPDGTNIVNVVLRTDGYGEECTWDVRNSSGSVLYSGGPYGDNLTINEQFYLDLDCNTFNIYDSYGDGGGSITIEDSEGTIFFYTNGAYGSGIFQRFSTVSTVLPEVSFNPVNGETNVNVSSEIIITFNQPMRKLDDTNITNGDIISIINLTDEASNGIVFSGTINTEKTIITLTPDENLPILNDITVSLLNNTIETYFDDALTETSITFTTYDNSGISQFGANVAIYPNPANEYLIVSNANNSVVTVIDIYGKTVLTKIVNSETDEINVAKLASGIYNVKIERDGLTTVKKISIIQ